jgi:hypothetical protein
MTTNTNKQKKGFIFKDNGIKRPDYKLGMYGEMPIVTIGDMEICMFTDQKDEKRIWMRITDEEGMEINDPKQLKELSELLKKWFWDNF